MSTIQNLGCSTAVGFGAALGTAGCLFQAGNAIKSAVQGDGAKTSMQRGLDNLLGEATSKASHVARNVFEGAVYTAGAVVLGGVAANAFDPEGNTVPTSLRLFGSCPAQVADAEDGSVEALGYFGTFAAGAQSVSDFLGLSNLLNAGSSAVSSLYSSTLGAADQYLFNGEAGNFISNNPIRSLVGAGVPLALHKRAFVMQQGANIAAGVRSIPGFFRKTPVQV